MKLYEKLNVQISYQNFGTAWLIILRGQEEDIELAFNSLYNFCATNGSLDYPEQTHTVATLWSNEDNMCNYFKIRFSLAHPEFEGAIYKGNCPECNAYIQSNMQQFSETSEMFMDFGQPKFVPETYSFGRITAEKPDEDFRDAVISHAFKDKREEPAEESEITNERRDGYQGGRIGDVQPA